YAHRIYRLSRSCKSKQQCSASGRKMNYQDYIVRGHERAVCTCMKQKQKYMKPARHCGHILQGRAKNYKPYCRLGGLNSDGHLKNIFYKQMGFSQNCKIKQSTSIT